MHFDESTFVERYAQRFDLKIDEDWSMREARLYILHCFLDGTVYDYLQPFHLEYQGGGESGTYIPLAKRRPSVIYKLPKIIVDASVSMLFGEGHFPVVRCEHENTTKFLQYVTRVCDLKSVMVDAARKGSIGSVVVLVKVLEGHFYFEAIHSTHLTPVFKQYRPKELERLIEKKKVDGDTLLTRGYDIKKDDRKEKFFIVREWNENEEIYYLPYKVEDAQNEDFRPTRDIERSTVHGLGFVTAVWMKNLPKSGSIDGYSTFQDIVDICIEIDYQISQHGRLLRYNSDPTLVIKNPTSLEGSDLIKGTGALNLDEKGDAYLLEITNGATKSVIEYVKHLREIALEMVRGNRGNPDKVHGAQSGEALKMLNFELVSLVEEMRLTYGEYGLNEIYCMILKMYQAKGMQIDIPDYAPDNANCEGHLVLDWPAWYPPTSMDKYNEAQTLEKLTTVGILSKRTATETIADEYNILDIDAELGEVENDADKMYDKEAKLKNSVERKPTKVEPK